MTTQADLDALALAVATLHDQCDTVTGKTPINSVLIAGLQNNVAQLTADNKALAADKQALINRLVILDQDIDAEAIAAAKLQADK